MKQNTKQSNTIKQKQIFFKAKALLSMIAPQNNLTVYFLLVILACCFFIGSSTDIIFVAIAALLSLLFSVLSQYLICKTNIPSSMPYQSRAILKKYNSYSLILSFVFCLVAIIITAFRKENISYIVLVCAHTILIFTPRDFFSFLHLNLLYQMKKLQENNIVIKDSILIENLNAVNTICTNISGILTQNKKRVAQFWFNNEIHPIEKLNKADHELFIHSLLLCNNARQDDKETSIDFSLLNMTGINKAVLDQAYPRLAEIPFSPHTKTMTTVHQYKDGQIVFSKGAPENILQLCDKVLIDGYPCYIQNYISTIEKDINTFSSNALKVIAVAYRWNQDGNTDYKSGFTFLGFVGIVNLPHMDAQQAGVEAKNLGIDTILLTGDNLDRAYALAKKLDICESRNQVILASDFCSWSQEKQKANINNYKLFARVTPEDKSIIVQLLQESGRTVAVINGDSNAVIVNPNQLGNISNRDDALLNLTSSKESTLLIPDKSLSCLINIFKHSKIIMLNIKKALSFAISGMMSDFVSLFILLLASSFTLSLSQVLLVSLFLPLLPFVSLIFNKSNPQQSHFLRPASETFMSHNNIITILFNSVCITMITILAFAYGKRIGGILYGQSMAIATLGISKILSSLNFHLLDAPLFNKFLFSNWRLWLAVLISALLHIGSTQHSIGNQLFNTVPLALADWLLILVGSFCILFANELLKSFITPQFNTKTSILLSSKESLHS